MGMGVSAERRLAWVREERITSSGEARMSGHWPVPTEKRRKKLAIRERPAKHMRH